MDKAKEFLKEYEKLCQKYGMGLQGCGCCGSPYLVVYNEKDERTIDIDEVNFEDNIVKIGLYGEKTIDQYFEEV